MKPDRPLGYITQVTCVLRNFRRAKPLRVAGLTAGASLALYSLATLGVFAFLKHQRGIHKVTYGDVFLPQRWDNLREIKGDHYVAAGQQALLDGNLPRASSLIHAGLRLAPANLTGRLSLAQLYLNSKRPDLAEACLTAGLTFHRQNAAYLAPFLSFLLEQKKDSTVLKICRELLPLLPSGSDRDQLLALAAATASSFLGNFDQADDYIRIANLRSRREGQLLSARIAWDRGHKELALIEIRELLGQHPHDPEIYAELTQRLREANRDDEAQRIAVSFQIANPEHYQPRLDLARHFLENRDLDRVEREIEGLLRAAPNHTLALVAIGDFAASNGDAMLTESLEQKARSLNLNADPLMLLTIEADLVAGRYRRVMDRVKSLYSTHPDLAKSHAPLLLSFQTIAHFGLGEPEFGDLALSHFLNHAPPRALHLLKIAERLIAVSAVEPAIKVLTAAINADPLNQPALARLVSIELSNYRTAGLPAHLQLLLATRRPSRDLLRVAYHQLGSDSFLFIPDRGPLLESIRSQLAGSVAEPRRIE